jgi:hypothetical protein
MRKRIPAKIVFFAEFPGKNANYEFSTSDGMQEVRGSSPLSSTHKISSESLKKLIPQASGRAAFPANVFPYYSVVRDGRAANAKEIAQVLFAQSQW